SLGEDHVQQEVLHRRVEHFPDGAGTPVARADEADVAAVEVGEDGGQVTRTLEGGTGGETELDTHLGGDDRGEGGLAQAGRGGEQDVVEGATFLDGGFE